MSVVGRESGTFSVMEGESGTMSFFSLMDWTIFSNPNEVICFSRPRLLVKLPRDDAGDVRTISTGKMLDECEESE